jgi:hypothetical protein
MDVWIYGHTLAHTHKQPAHTHTHGITAPTQRPTPQLASPRAGGSAGRPGSASHQTPRRFPPFLKSCPPRPTSTAEPSGPPPAPVRHARPAGPPQRSPAPHPCLSWDLESLRASERHGGRLRRALRGILPRGAPLHSEPPSACPRPPTPDDARDGGVSNQYVRRATPQSGSPTRMGAMDDHQSIHGRWMGGSAGRN